MKTLHLIMVLVVLCTAVVITGSPMLYAQEAKAPSNESLAEAAGSGHIDVVRSLIESGADVNAKDNKGGTALNNASYKGRTDIVKLLLYEGADVNSKTEHGTSALLSAVLGGYIDIVKLLLDKGADVNTGDSPFIFASYAGKIEIMKLLLEKGADMNVKDQFGRTALMSASFAGSANVVKFLLDNGADINLKDNKGRTALIASTENGNSEITKLLQKKETEQENRLLPRVKESFANAKELPALPVSRDFFANNITVNANGSILSYRGAYISAAGDAFALIPSKGATWQPINSTDFLILKVENISKGITNILAHSNSKETPVGYVIDLSGNLMIVLPREIIPCDIELLGLLKKYIPIGKQEASASEDANGTSKRSLIDAASDGDIETAKVLIKNGADVNEKYIAGWTALMRASAKGYIDIVRILLDNGADVNMKNNDGSTALSVASNKSYIEIMKLLIDKGADVNTKTAQDFTILMIASLEGKNDVVKLLLEKGADVNAKAKDSRDSTALMMAAFTGHVDTANMLRAAGAKE